MSPCFHSFQEPIWKLIKTCLWSGSNMRGGSRHRKPGRHRERKGQVVPPSLCPGNSKLKEYWQKNDTAKKQHLTCNLTLVQKSYSDEKQWKICIKKEEKIISFHEKCSRVNIENLNYNWEKLFVSKNGQMKSDSWYKFVKIQNLLQNEKLVINFNQPEHTFSSFSETWMDKSTYICVPDLGKWASHNL